MRVAGIIVAGVAVVLGIVVLFNGCGEGPCKNLRDCRPTPAAHLHAAGCGHEMPDAGAPDAGCPDAGDGVIHPGCALSPFPE